MDRHGPAPTRGGPAPSEASRAPGAPAPRLVAAGALALLLRASPGSPAPALGPSGEAPRQSEFDRYLKRAALLKQYRDQGQLDAQAMLRVLEAAGVVETAAGRGGGQKSFAAGFRPFRVRAYAGLWRWPLKAGIVSSEFKRRWGRRHEGIDIAADPGDPVLAAAPGTVLYAGDTLRGYGNALIVRHDQKTTSLYAHNEALLVQTGDEVRAGQAIARIGSTGRSTGPHLHFEVRRGGKAVNPRSILVRSRF